MSQNLYDQSSRYLVRFDPPGFFRWLHGLEAEDFVFRGWLDTRAISFPGEPDHTSDMVAHLMNLSEHGIPWALLLEFQIVPDPEMFARIMRHLAAIWQYVRPDDERGSRFWVSAAVINLTGRGNCSQEMHWPKAGLKTQLKVVERNLEHESADHLLNGVELGHWPRSLLPLIPLMIGGNEPGIIDRWVILAGAEPDSYRRSDYAAIALLFAERAGRKTLWSEKLKGWNVTESAYINEFIAKGRAEGEAKGRAEGEAKGRAEGEAKGRAEGEAKGRWTVLLELLKEKFQTLPSELEITIYGTTDVNQLRMWTTAAVKANTLEEFRAASGL